MEIDYKLNEDDVIVKYDYIRAEKGTRDSPPSSAEVEIESVIYKEVDVLKIVSDLDLEEIKDYIKEKKEDEEEHR